MSFWGGFLAVTIYSLLGFLYDHFYFSKRLKRLEDKISKGGAV